VLGTLTGVDGTGSNEKLVDNLRDELSELKRAFIHSVICKRPCTAKRPESVEGGTLVLDLIGRFIPDLTPRLAPCYAVIGPPPLRSPRQDIPECPLVVVNQYPFWRSILERNESSDSLLSLRQQISDAMTEHYSDSLPGLQIGAMTEHLPESLINLPELVDVLRLQLEINLRELHVPRLRLESINPNLEDLLINLPELEGPRLQLEINLRELDIL